MPDTAGSILQQKGHHVWSVAPHESVLQAIRLMADKGIGALVDPGMTVASLSVPLVAPMTEYGDRINQLDFSVTKTIKVAQTTIQPKFDLFNMLNVSPVYAVRSQNYGTMSYLQPSSILVGRVFQLGAVVKF